MTPPVAGGARVNLFGRPSIDGHHACHRVRGQKTWALLAYLVLSKRAPTRNQLAALLFAEADDPLRALRWGLAEIRRALRGLVTLEGDPVVLVRHPDLVFDVDVVASGPWTSAVRLPAIGAELLEGLSLSRAAVFDSWLLAEQRRLAAATADHLRAAARASGARGDLWAAIDYSVRRVAMTPLDEESHADLIGLYRMVGDHHAAQRQYCAYERVLETELGVLPGAASRAALQLAACSAA